MNEGKTKDSPRYTIYTDGAARGNPGESASGFSIFDASGKEVASSSFYNGIKTNNFAEYTAIIRALEWCEANLKSPERFELSTFRLSVGRSNHAKLRALRNQLLCEKSFN